MDWDLGTSGLRYLAAMPIGFGLLAQLLAWRAAPKWLWALVSGLYFGVGILVSEFWFGWATEEDLQPNIDGLSRDEVLLIGLVPVAFAVAVTRWMGEATRSSTVLTSTRNHRQAIKGNRRRTHCDWTPTFPPTPACVSTQAMMGSSLVGGRLRGTPNSSCRRLRPELLQPRVERSMGA